MDTKMFYGWCIKNILIFCMNRLVDTFKKKKGIIQIVRKIIVNIL